MSKVEMKIEKTKSGKGKNFVMAGFKDEKYGWFEKYFTTEAKAKAFAQKKGWPVK